MKSEIYIIELMLDIINQELAMYDDLSKNDRYKCDREKASYAWDAIESIAQKIKNIEEKL